MRKSDEDTTGGKTPDELSLKADVVKITDGTSHSYYECVVCQQMKEAVPGKKIGIYLKETLGTRNGFICPDCEATRK